MHPSLYVLCLLMVYIINDWSLPVLHSAPIRDWAETTWLGMGGGHRLTMNGRWQQALPGSRASRPLLSNVLPPLQPQRCERRCWGGGSRGEDGGVRQGGAAEAQRQEKQEAASQTTKEQREEEEEEEAIESTGRECRQSRREGGLPDWIGPAMPWWSMGQVLGFSHCRESVFVLLPSVSVCCGPALVHLTTLMSCACLPAACYEHRRC